MKKDLLQFVLFLGVLCSSDEGLIGSCALYCPTVTSGPCKDCRSPLLYPPCFYYSMEQQFFHAEQKPYTKIEHNISCGVMLVLLKSICLILPLTLLVPPPDVDKQCQYYLSNPPYSPSFNIFSYSSLFTPKSYFVFPGDCIVPSSHCPHFNCTLCFIQFTVTLCSSTESQICFW